MITSKWIRFDERTNALDYLEKSFSFLQTVEENPQNWKWVIITLHSALYGFAISACKGMNSESVITRTKKGFERLIDFNKALRRCQDPSWMSVNIDYKEFKLSQLQKESIRKLHQVFRNNFEHFIPTSWSIEIHGMPIIVLNCLDVIRFLLTYSDVGWLLRDVKVRRVKSIIFQSTIIIKHSSLYKEALILNTSINLSGQTGSISS